MIEQLTENDKNIIEDFFGDVDTSRPTDQIVCIVDRSGSMGMIKPDAEGGLNAFIDEQKQVPGDAELTLVEFDSQINRVYDRVNLNEVGPYNLTPRGATALFDAIGQTLNDILSWDLADQTKVIVSIVTDGGENSSREYTHEQITQLIKDCEAKEWEVTFLAANQDAMAVGGSLGLNSAHTMDWHATGEGVHEAYATASVNATMYRTSNKSAGEGIRDYQGKTAEEVMKEKQSKGSVDNNE